MGLFWAKYARRIFAIVSTTSIPNLAPVSPTEATVDPPSRGSRLDADHPENGVLIPRRFTVGNEVAIHQVGCRARVTIPLGGDDAAAAADADDPCRPHQPGNPLLPDRPTFGTQLRMDTRRAIRAARDGMDRAHLLQQFAVRGGTGRRQARTPSIVAGG